MKRNGFITVLIVAVGILFYATRAPAPIINSGPIGSGVPIGMDTIKDYHIDWGTGANQVSWGDMILDLAGADLASADKLCGYDDNAGTNECFTMAEVENYLGTVYAPNSNVDVTLGAVVDSPSDADSFYFWKAPVAVTITDIDCIVGAATSVVIDVQECGSDGTGCATVDATITCDTDGATDDGAFSNGGIDAGDWLLLDIGTVTGTPGHVAVTVTYDED